MIKKFGWQLVLPLLVVMMGCGSSEEGCLDIQATNFDPSVDVACGNCCEFPTLSLRINHRYDSVNFNLNTVYHDASATPFTIQGIQFYISGVELVRSDGSSVRVSDKLTVTSADGSTREVVDDFAFYRKSIGTYSTEDIGSITANGTFSSIRFRVGVTGANDALPNLMPANHPLGIQSDTLWQNNTGYIFNKVTVQPDTASSTYHIYSIDSDDNLVTVELDYDLDVNSGFDVNLVVELDYFKLFQAISFGTDDVNTVIGKIVGNTADAFSVAE